MNTYYHNDNKKRAKRQDNYSYSNSLFIWEYTMEYYFIAYIQEGKYKEEVNTFFKNKYSYVEGYVMKKTGISKQDFKEVFNQSFIRIVEKYKNGYRIEKATFLTIWVQINYYAALDFLSKKNKKRTLKKDVFFEENYFEKKDLALHIRNNIEKIVGNKEQVKVALLFYKGYKYDEIVAMTSYKTNGAARNALMKAKQKVAAYLNENQNQKLIIQKLIYT